jgi:hypothetical protein
LIIDTNTTLSKRLSDVESSIDVKVNVARVETSEQLASAVAGLDEKRQKVVDDLGQNLRGQLKEMNMTTWCRFCKTFFFVNDEDDRLEGIFLATL